MSYQAPLWHCWEETPNAQPAIMKSSAAASQPRASPGICCHGGAHAALSPTSPCFASTWHESWPPLICYKTAMGHSLATSIPARQIGVSSSDARRVVLDVRMPDCSLCALRFWSSRHGWGLVCKDAMISSGTQAHRQEKPGFTKTEDKKTIHGERNKLGFLQM